MQRALECERACLRGASRSQTLRRACRYRAQVPGAWVGCPRVHRGNPMAEVRPRNVSLPGLFDRLFSWFVSSERSPEEQRTCRLIVGFTLTVLCWSPLYAAFYLVALPPREAQVALTSLVVGMSLVAAVPTMIRM